MLQGLGGGHMNAALMELGWCGHSHKRGDFTQHTMQIPTLGWFYKCILPDNKNWSKKKPNKTSSGMLCLHYIYREVRLLSNVIKMIKLLCILYVFTSLFYFLGCCKIPPLNVFQYLILPFAQLRCKPQAHSHTCTDFYGSTVPTHHTYRAAH